MSKFNFNGMGVALITPFSPDGTIDEECLESLVERLISSDADYIVVLGTTAETPTLSAAERVAIRELVRRKVAGRVPLVLGMGGNCTATLTEELHHWDGAGYEAILSVVPFYNKPNQEGIFRHFSAVAKASPVDVLLYNVPGRTGCNMTPDTVLRLVKENPNIIGVKAASGNVEQIKKMIVQAPQGFAVISGDDGLTLELIGYGACGVISVIGNALPSSWGELVRLALKGATESAEALQSRMEPLLKLLFREGNPTGIKGVMSAMGLIEPVLRLPLVTASDKLMQEIREFLDNNPDLQ